MTELVAVFFAALALGLLILFAWGLIVEVRALRADNRRLMHRLGQYHGISNLGWSTPELDRDNGMRDHPAPPSFRFKPKTDN